VNPAPRRWRDPVVDRAPDLQQQVVASARPAHLQRLVHPPIDQEVRRPLRHQRANLQPCTISFSVIDQPGALATQIVVDLMQRMPQLSESHAARSMTALPLVDKHGLADAIERDLGVLGHAVPDAPVQSRDLRDDRCLCRHATRDVGG
jgi:hypothetical protein